MNTMNNAEKKQNLTIAEQYYRALANKDLETASAFLSPDVELISPLATIQSKSLVIQALQGFLHAIEKLEIRFVIENGSQTILFLNPYFHEPIKELRTAALITIENSLIKQIELFYDSSPLQEKKNKIFIDEK